MTDHETSSDSGIVLSPNVKRSESAMPKLGHTLSVSSDGQQSYGSSDDSAVSSKIMNGVILGPRRTSHNDGVNHTHSDMLIKLRAKKNTLPSYIIEHLSSFLIDKKEGIQNVEDCIKKLKEHDTAGKIWSQEVILQYNDREIFFLNSETKDLVETYTLSSLQRVDSVMNEGQYDSILAMMYKDQSMKQPEYMLFQSDTVPANVLASELRTAITNSTDKSKASKKKKTNASSTAGAASSNSHEDYNIVNNGSQIYPPPPNEPAPIPPTDTYHRKKVAAITAAEAVAQVNNPKSPTRLRMEKDGNVLEDDSLQMISYKTEREVQILNHCFDDIENFVARLRKAADSYIELQKRKKGKDRKKKGDGILELRARAPAEYDYIDTFQKFKYSFNLLAKLKSHIHDPNASELIHFLFIPLNIVLDSCQGCELASTVTSPLLTIQTIDLLRNCLSSKEMDLWFSLGSSWTVSRVSWPKDHYVPPYIPVFKDGWEPPQFVVPQRAPITAEISAVINANAAKIAKKEDQRRGAAEGEERVQPFPPTEPCSLQNTHFAAHRSGESQPMKTTRPQSMLVTSTNQQTASTSHDAMIRAAGSSSTATERPASMFVATTTTTNGHTDTAAIAAFKANVEKHVDRNYEAQSVAVNKRNTQNNAKALFDFVARNYKELTVMAGEILEILDASRVWWAVRNVSGQCGFVPSTILESVSSDEQPSVLPSPPSGAPPLPPAPPALQQPFYHHQMQTALYNIQSKDTATVYTPDSPGFSAVPLPPPAPPAPPPLVPSERPPTPPPPPSVFLAQNKTRKTTQNPDVMMRINQNEDTTHAQIALVRNKLKKTEINANKKDELQAELKQRMSGVPLQKSIPVRLTNPSITHISTTDEVKQWLLSKSFSTLTVNSLGVLTGAQLFSLTRDELREVCSDEGARVFSQITVQKSLLQEANECSELSAIMIRRKERAELGDDDNNYISYYPPPDFTPPTPPDTISQASGSVTP